MSEDKDATMQGSNVDPVDALKKPPSDHSDGAEPSQRIEMKSETMTLKEAVPLPLAGLTMSAATLHQKVVGVVALLVSTAILLWFGSLAIDAVDRATQTIHRVQWQASETALLKPGPPTFWHDVRNGHLVHLGVIDTKVKQELIALFSPTSDQPASTEMRNYWAAVNELAFASNQQREGLLIATLLLGGLAGAIGVQLRSLVNFVGHACYTNTLDMGVWWPYYVIRPFTGFVLGVIIVIIVQAGFFVAGNGVPGGTLWWTSIAFLAGFGEQEFTQRLRQLTKTLFGEPRELSRSVTTVSTQKKP